MRVMSFFRSGYLVYFNSWDSVSPQKLWNGKAPLIPIHFNPCFGAAPGLASSMFLIKLHSDQTCRMVKLLLLTMATAYTLHILLHAVIELYFDT